MCVLEAPGEEGVYVGSINMDELRKHRENDVMGWKFRRPEKYDILLQKEK